MQVVDLKQPFLLQSWLSVGKNGDNDKTGNTEREVIDLQIAAYTLVNCPLDCYP